jgi:THUMP domain-like/RNA cap guanine-N2 methyltransferase
MTADQIEAWVLFTEAGACLLDSVTGMHSIGPADMTRLRTLAPAPAVSAAIRIARARAKAALKFERGTLMWAEPIAVEQATSEPVARHKAVRFTSALVVDLCAGIGGDTLALAARSDVMAVDLDPGMCRRLQFNAVVYDVSQRVLPIQARAESFAIPSGAWVHLDPDRRSSRKQRASRLADYAPGPEFWKATQRQAEGGAIKLSPASDFAEIFAGPQYEIELVSLRGECKEATVWFGEAVSCLRRATRLPENVTWTDRDAPTTEHARVSELSSLIYDPDPALLRAGLLDGFALAHQLARVSHGVDYLTGDQLISTPFLTAFGIQDVGPLDLKRLRRMIARYDIGQLEIKVRGVRITPERLRAELNPRGSRGATLLVVGGIGPVQVVLAHRTSTGGSTTSSTVASAGCDVASGGAPSPLPAG